MKDPIHWKVNEKLDRLVRGRFWIVWAISFAVVAAGVAVGFWMAQ